MFEGHQKKEESPKTFIIQPKAKDPTKTTKTDYGQIISISKYPNHPNCFITTVQDKHNAPDFQHYLKVYLNSQLDPCS